MTRIAVVQSCYIPWKGYFDMMRRADRFVLYDCVQYTTRDWRNRNRIKTAHGPLWLTIPVRHGSRAQPICEVMTAHDQWQEQHWQSLRHAYGKSPYFSEYAPLVHAWYANCKSRYLSEINLHFLQQLNALLGISTPITLLSEPVAPTQKDKTAQLLAICQSFNATQYISGPAAQDYFDMQQFTSADIEVCWMDYGHYPEYNQSFPPFLPTVSIMDMLFNLGKDTPRYF